MLPDLPKVRSLALGTLVPPHSLGQEPISLPLLPLLLIKASMGAVGDRSLSRIFEGSLGGEVIAE